MKIFRPIQNDEASAKRSLAKTIRNPENWLSSAERLLLAMRLLEPSIADFWSALDASLSKKERLPDSNLTCCPIHLMLAGLAVENLCKGYLIKNGEVDGLSDDEVAKWPKRYSHEILKLTRKVKFPPNPQEEILLIRLQSAVHWRGRYPAPNQHWGFSHQLPGHPKHSEDQGLIQDSLDVQRIAALIDRIKDHLSRG